MTDKLIEKFISRSEEQTKKIGFDFGKGLNKGVVILMYGEAGAGKTVFTKGLAESLGVTERVLSPTFALRNDYTGRLILHHLDMYRVEDESEVEESGALEGIFDGNDVTVIEWAENIEEFINFPHYRIDVKYLGEKKREITVTYTE